MSGQRIALIVLIVIASLFAAGIGAGVKNRRQDQSIDEKSARNYSPPAWIDRFGELLAPLSLGLKPEEMRAPGAGFALKGATIVVEQSPVTFNLAPSDEKFRKATFLLKSGAGLKIDYEASDTDAGELRRQVWPAEKDDPNRASLVILKSGGRLKMSCDLKPPCVVELQ
jgi:hypothetical protein